MEAALGFWRGPCCSLCGLMAAGGFSGAQCRTTLGWVWPSRAGALWAMRVATRLAEQISAAAKAWVYFSVLEEPSDDRAAGRAALFVLGGALLPFLPARVAGAGFPMNYLSWD